MKQSGDADAVIRPAGVADGTAVFDLTLQFATSYTPSRVVFDAAFQALVTGDSNLLQVAECGSQVIGYVLAAKYLTLFANGPIVELIELMVAQDYRGQGVGRMLVAAIERYARSAAAVEVTVPTRRAREFYLKLGYVESATFLKRTL